MADGKDGWPGALTRISTTGVGQQTKGRTEMKDGFGYNPHHHAKERTVFVSRLQLRRSAETASRRYTMEDFDSCNHVPISN
jgi:hypothetical protein